MEEDEYQNQEDCQDYSDYKVQGYHPVVLGQKFNSVYIVVQKLGWGHFSTVWLSYNQTNKNYVALKIQKSKQNYSQSAMDELQILKDIRQQQQNPQWKSYLEQIQKSYPSKINIQLCQPLLLLDSFTHYGIHGKHICSVFELMGPNLLDLIQHFEFKQKRMPLWLVKKITRDVLIGLVYLHEHCNIIHTDLKPENIMMKLESAEQNQLIQQIKGYKVKPISMKFLKVLQSSKNPKNKKKQQKKKLKKKKLQSQAQGKGENVNQNDEEQQASESSNLVSNSEVSKQVQSASIIEPSFQSPNIQNSQPQKVNIQISEAQKSIKQQNSENKQQNHQSVKQNQQAEGQQIPQEKIVEEPCNQAEDQQQDIDMYRFTWKNVKINLNDKLYFKIADMGNACYTHKHFSDDIQTRQYRSPEALLGQDYFTNTDVFSLACTVYEMLTNNYLFKPKKIPGIKKNQDHMFQMIETLGPIDKDFATEGTYSAQIFNKKGKLINGNPKTHYPISRRLFEKQGYDPVVAVQIQDFLLPMLAYDPKNRCSARTCLNFKWLWT